MRQKEMVKMISIFAKNGDTRRHFTLGAIGIRSDGTLVMARNEPTRNRNPHAHAEHRLTKKLGMDASMVLVVRTLKDGSLAMAKPCKNCQAILKSHRVKKVFYTTNNSIELMLND